MTDHTSDQAERIREQRAILADPFRFADEQGPLIFGEGPIGYLLATAATERHAYHCTQAAMKLVERAIATPAANVEHALGSYDDHVFDFAMDYEATGQRRGVILECLRRMLVEHVAELEAEEDTEDEYLARDRARLDALAAGEGQALVNLRERVAATGRRADRANDGANDGAAVA